MSLNSINQFKWPRAYKAPDIVFGSEGVKQQRMRTLPYSFGERDSQACNSRRVIEGGSRGHGGGPVPKTSGLAWEASQREPGNLNKHRRSQHHPE